MSHENNNQIITIDEKIYIVLCIMFCSLIILGNMTYQKFVSLHVPMLYTFELSVGAILYPLTFLITDLITEFYGKEKAKFCLHATLLISGLVTIIITFMDLLPATNWSKINDTNFHEVFGFYKIAFFGSLFACYVSQTIDIYLYLTIRKATKGRYLWLRNNISTLTSLFIDTCIVVTVLTIFNVLPRDHMWSLIYNSYSWKLFFSICCTPLFYACVHIKSLFKNGKDIPNARYVHHL